VLGRRRRGRPLGPPSDTSHLWGPSIGADPRPRFMAPETRMGENPVDVSLGPGLYRTRRLGLVGTGPCPANKKMWHWVTPCLGTPPPGCSAPLCPRCSAPQFVPARRATGTRSGFAGEQHGQVAAGSRRAMLLPGTRGTGGEAGPCARSHRRSAAPREGGGVRGFVPNPKGKAVKLFGEAPAKDPTSLTTPPFDSPPRQSSSKAPGVSRWDSAL
jgi:hypothetical protein